MNTNVQRLRLAALLVASCGCLATAGAQNAASDAWPDKPIRLVVSYPAGGSVDSAARALATALSAKVGQPVVVDNRAGADGTIGMGAVQRAPGDGYTLAVSLRGAMTVAPFTSKLPFDPLTDFTALAGIAQTPEIYATRPRTGMQSLRDLPEGYRRNGNKMSIGFVGALPRLLAELLAQETSVDLLRVPYKSLPAALQDLMGDQTDMIVGDAIGVLAEQVKAGKVVALAVTSTTRLPDLPQVPTTRELGYPQLAGNQWYALYGPRTLPPALAAKISTTVAEVLRQPAVVQQLARVGLQPFPVGAAELASMMVEDTRFWKGVAAKGRIVPE